MQAELQRRQSNTDRLRAFFLARPNTWILATELESIAGRQAWRTRVSELRRALERTGDGTIENVYTRQQQAVVASYYRYLPHIPLGPDAGVVRESTLFPL